MRNEIFISYAHEDSDHLKELRKHLVPYERRYGISHWADPKIEPGSAWNSEIFRALGQAQVAVLLVSADFLSSDFIVQNELPAILQSVESGQLRLVWVLVSACNWEATSIATYQPVNDLENPVNMLSEGNKQQVWTNIAKAIVHSCEAPRLTVSPGPTSDRKSVLLAQVTDDMEEEAAQLRSYLAQYEDEVAIMPAGPYPQGGEAFKSAFERDLAQATLFVQLLGLRAGRTAPDLPEGYTRWQYERVKSESARVQIMQWRRPDLDVSAISNPAYKAIITAETVVASGLETFKGQILGWARKRSPKIREIRPSFVFIDADEKDFEIAQKVIQLCEANNLTGYLPIRGASAEETLKDLEANLSECDGLVVIYGDTTPGWIRSHFRRLHKVRPKDTPPRLLTVCVGPPPKPDPGMSVPNLHLINCSEGWNMDQVRKAFAELSA